MRIHRGLLSLGALVALGTLGIVLTLAAATHPTVTAALGALSALRDPAAPLTTGTVSPLPCGLLSEDFENETLGVFQGDWAVVPSTLGGYYMAEAFDYEVAPCPPFCPGAQPGSHAPPGAARPTGEHNMETHFAIPANAQAAQLSFWHDLQAGLYGRLALTLSTDNGATWTMIPLFTDRLDTPSARPTSWHEVVDLLPYSGHQVIIHFHTDYYGPACYDACGVVWDIDDVSVTYAAPGCATSTPIYPRPTRTPTYTPTSTPTPHPGRFQDVPPSHPFYSYVECMGLHQIISGYPCGGPFEPCVPDTKPYFRPGNPVTRGQVAKMLNGAASWADPVPSSQQTFADVAPASTFWLWVERLAGRGFIGGYPCGSPGEPCSAPTNRPYFRPNANLTRGQFAKITAQAAGYTQTPTGQTFADVAPSSTFWVWVEQVAGHGIVGGYPCGGPGEPCQPPGNRPYYRPGNDVTRGQTAKILTSAFLPGCPSPTPTPTVTTTPTPTDTGTPTSTATPTITVTGTPPTATPEPTHGQAAPQVPTKVPRR